MSSGPEPSTDGVAGNAAKARETLSQFVARVLNQLALSAWLPAAALMMLVVFIVDLGAVLDSPKQKTHEWPVLTALRMMGSVSIGGAIVFLSAVIVLAMVTQAFAYEAIRFLQGNWGTSLLAERVGDFFCSRHIRRRKDLAGRHEELTRCAWCAVRRVLENDNDQRINAGKSIVVSPNVIAKAEATLIGGRSTVQLSDHENATLEMVMRNWMRQAPPGLVRRRANVQARLGDYPTTPDRFMPTRLGNILRRYLDRASAEGTDYYGYRVFDDVPLSVRVELAEQRSMLDLYCSMVFVGGFVTCVAVARFGWHNWAYALSAMFVGIAGMMLMYRASISTARHYGEAIVAAAGYLEKAKAASSGASSA